MESATVSTAKGSIAGVDLRAGLARTRGSAPAVVKMPEMGSRSGPLVGVTPVRAGVETIFRSKNKARYVRVHAASRDLEDDPSGKPPAKSTGTVLPYVAVACLGAILFGYHLGVVNGALEYLSRDLGISENTVLQVSAYLQQSLLYLPLDSANPLDIRNRDMSSNNIHDTIPYQLPPNLTYLNFAGNSLSGNIPYSLNLSHNSLTQSIGEVFANLKDLSDLSILLPTTKGDSKEALTEPCYLQNNQLTGQLNVLVNLDLTNLDISNNDFSGWIPQQFKSIPNLQIGGNSFSNGPAPLPPPYTPPPPGRPHHNHNQSQAPTNTPQGSGGQASDLNGGSKKRHLSTSSIIGIVIAILCAALVAIFCLRNVAKAKGENQENSKEPLGSLSIGAEKDTNTVLWMCILSSLLKSTYGLDQVVSNTWHGCKLTSI